MEPLFGWGSSSLVGIDIGSSAIKLLELEPASNGEAFKGIKHFAVVALPEGAVEGKRVVDVAIVVAAIKEAIRKSKTKTRSVSAAVSGVTAMTRILQLPANLKENEMETQVEYEADRKIPQPLDEIRFDFDLLGLSENNPETMDVLLVASRADVVDGLTSTLEMAGLKPAVIDVESYAINHCFNHVHGDVEPECVAVADMGASSVDFHVMNGETILYSREYNFGGNSLTKALQGAYNLSYDEAEAVKVRGDWPRGAREGVMREFIVKLTQEVRGAFQIYDAGGKGEPIKRLYLAGGCALMPGVEESISDTLDIQVSVLDPFVGMKNAKRIYNSDTSTPAMAMVCGLATRRVG